VATHDWASRNAATRLLRLRQPRIFQTALGLIWLLDGVLQFRAFLYSKGSIALLTGTASGQPYWFASSIDWVAHITEHDMTLFNTLFALIKVCIGLGLLYRRTVKPALALSFAWAPGRLVVQRGVGDAVRGHGGAAHGRARGVLLYAIIGLLVWPGERTGGLLGARGARTMWATLWLVMAWSWLLAPNSSANATTNAIMSAPGGGWLHSLQSSVASSARGHGLVIALVLALLPAAIGVAVAPNWRPVPFLALASVLNMGYWAVAQGFGGIFYTNAPPTRTRARCRYCSPWSSSR
jgi:hypothetical protein